MSLIIIRESLQLSMRSHKKPAILGFSKYKDKTQYYHCSIHQGARLLPMPGEEGLYWCPECGTPYNPSEVKSDTKITSRFQVIPTGKLIQSGKNRGSKDKDYYDKAGNKISKNDPDIMRDIAEGHTVVYYNTNEDITTAKSKEPYKVIKGR